MAFKMTARMRAVYALVYVPLVVVRLVKVALWALSMLLDWSHYRVDDLSYYTERLALRIEDGARWLAGAPPRPRR